VGDGAAPLHCGSDTVTKREQLGLSQRTAPGHRRGPVRRALALNWQCASLSELPETATRARKAALGQGQRALNFPRRGVQVPLHPYHDAMHWQWALAGHGPPGAALPGRVRARGSSRSSPESRGSSLGVFIAALH
jgi:hypothetical protein